MKKQQGKGRIRKLVSLEDLEQLNLNAAGLDVGDDEIWACVPEGRAVSAVRVFGTFTVDLYALADWLAECGVDTVAVESTGVYWIPVYEVLEGRGFEICLVNARHVKKMGGRKTDLLDCQWLRQLHILRLRSGQALWIAEGLLSTARRYLRSAGHRTPAGYAHPLSGKAHPAYAKGIATDEREVDQCIERRHRNDGDGDHTCHLVW